MTNSSITLVMDVTGEAATYQWQSATSKRGPFTDIEGANGSTYTFTPTHGYWYRCVVDGTASRAVKAVTLPVTMEIRGQSQILAGI